MLKKLAGDQKGQTTVFVALSMMVLVCFLAFMVNLGQMVHDRILTQEVADMIALSAANVQAAGLNEIADLNFAYRQLETDLYINLLAGPWANAGEAQNCTQWYKDGMKLNADLQQNVNQYFAYAAHAVAGLMLLWYNKEYGWDRPFVAIPWIHYKYPMQYLTAVESVGTRFCPYSHYVPVPFAAGPARYFMRLRPISFYISVAKGLPIGAGVSTWSSYNNKDDRVAAYYRVLVFRTKSKAFMNLPDFGFDVKLPMIWAMSLAMPTGGNVEKGQPKYFARFAPVGTEFQFDLPMPYVRDKFKH